MNEANEVKPYLPQEIADNSQIKPAELAEGLARQEKQEETKELFEQALLAKIVEASISQAGGREYWEQKYNEALQKNPDELTLADRMAFSHHDLGNFSEMTSKEDIVLRLKAGERLQPLFHFGKNGELDLKFDILFRDPVEFEQAVYDKAYLDQVKKIHDGNPTSEELKNFASAGLPNRNQQHIKPIDLQHEPDSDMTSIKLLDFGEIWDKVEKADPEGASVYLQEIITKEQGELEKQIDIAKFRINAMETRRKNLISQNQPAGRLLSDLNTDQAWLENAQKRLAGLLEFKRKRLPGI